MFREKVITRLFDVLEYVSFEISPITRAQRVAAAEPLIDAGLSPEQREFVAFVLARYVENGEENLDRELLPDLCSMSTGQLHRTTTIRIRPANVVYNPTSAAGAVVVVIAIHQTETMHSL